MAVPVQTTSNGVMAKQIPNYSLIGKIIHIVRDYPYSRRITSILRLSLLYSRAQPDG